MPTKCAVAGCKNTYSISNKGTGISFHRFPRNNEKLYEEWIVRLRQEKGYTPPNKTATVCSDHFEKHCFDGRGLGCSGRLKNDAVPTLFKKRPKKQKDVNKFSAYNLNEKLTYTISLTKNSERTSLTFSAKPPTSSTENSSRLKSSILPTQNPNRTISSTLLTQDPNRRKSSSLPTQDPNRTVSSTLVAQVPSRTVSSTLLVQVPSCTVSSTQPAQDPNRRISSTLHVQNPIRIISSTQTLLKSSNLPVQDSNCPKSLTLSTQNSNRQEDNIPTLVNKAAPEQVKKANWAICPKSVTDKSSLDAKPSQVSILKPRANQVAQASLKGSANIKPAANAVRIVDVNRSFSNDPVIFPPAKRIHLSMPTIRPKAISASCKGPLSTEKQRFAMIPTVVSDCGDLLLCDDDHQDMETDESELIMTCEVQNLTESTDEVQDLMESTDEVQDLTESTDVPASATELQKPTRKLKIKQKNVLLDHHYSSSRDPDVLIRQNRLLTDKCAMLQKKYKVTLRMLSRSQNELKSLIKSMQKSFESTEST